MFSKKLTVLTTLILFSITLFAQNTFKENRSSASNSSEIVELENNAVEERSELKNFSAELLDKNVYVNWELSHTNDIQGFELYKSTDAESWEMVEFVDCTNNQEYAFQYIDNTPNWGINYYRIKTVDNEGNSALLRTAKVIYEYEIGADVGQFFPNPANNGSTKLTINVPNGGAAIINIHDGMGRIVKQYQKDVQSGTDTISLDLEGLTHGVYHTTIRVNLEIYSRTIMVNDIK